MKIMKNKKYILTLCLMCLLVLSGCVVALPVTEEDIAKVDEKVGLNGVLTDYMETQFEDKASSTTTTKDVEGQYSIYIMTDEEKDEVEVTEEENGFIFGNAQVGYLTLSNDYVEGDSPYTYVKKSDDVSLTVSIDGFPKGSDDLLTWVEFIEKTMNANGYSDINKTMDDENKQATLSLSPNEYSYWIIYVNEIEDRIYMTSITKVDINGVSSYDGTEIMNNRVYTK